ncbi:PLDc N-terminal domain-containing protein [Roseovarius sp. C7]|uniref:PLDc N-terminal domain-containing protein n=1 Tax=Roseovarius sp. C7 TaxID=3398643 RepID=UPI0039F68164
MTELSGIGGFILLILDIWAIVSIIGSGASNGKKVLWIVLVVLLPLLGFLIWLLAGPKSAAAT